MSETVQSIAPARSLITAAKWAACAIVLLCVGYALVRQLRQVSWSQVRFEWGPMLIGVACLLGVSVMQLAARRTLLIAYGYHLDWRVQIPAAWVPQLGKYVPGGVASVAGVMYILRKHGVPGAVGLSVAVLLDGMAVTVGFIVSTPLLLWGPVRAKWPSAWIACLVMVALGVVLLHPRVFVGLLNMVLRKLGRQPIERIPPVGRFVWPVLASFGQWVFAGLALWSMTLAVAPVEARMIPLFIAIAALAFTISYLMPFTPGGVGIREGVLLALGPGVGPAFAIVVVTMRVMQTLIEIALAGIGVLFLRNAESTASAA